MPPRRLSPLSPRRGLGWALKTTYDYDEQMV